MKKILGCFIIVVMIIGVVIFVTYNKLNSDLKESSEKHTYNIETSNYDSSSSTNKATDNISYSLNTIIDRTIVFATCANFDRFEYPVYYGGVVSESKHYDGFDIQLAKYIADKYNNEILINNMEFEELLNSLDTKESDVVISAMETTDSRKEYCDFSVPYYDGTQVILVLDDSDIKTINDLNGKLVATGPLSDTWELDELSIKYTEYESLEECVNRLKNKTCDAVVLDYSIATYFCSINNNMKIINSASFENYQLAIAVRKGNDILLNMINEALMEFKNNGIIDSLIKNYLIH